jgi:glycosyltransferase involved in cell wall biosynthesis
MIKSPLVSIITPCYNSELYISDTIKSIIEQSYKNIQYIIVDGGSTDNTMNIVKSYCKKMNLAGIEYKYISGPDKGMYDAVNKGIEISRGDIVGYINSDDKYASADAVETVVKYMIKKKAEWVSGYCGIIDKDDGRKYSLRSLPYYRCLYESLDWSYIFQPTAFFTRKIIDGERYNNSYRMAGDHDYFIRLGRKYSYYLIKKEIVHFRIHQNTLTTKYSSDSVREVQVVLQENNISLTLQRRIIGILTNISLKIINIDNYINKLIFSKLGV